MSGYYFKSDKKKFVNNFVREKTVYVVYFHQEMHSRECICMVESDENTLKSLKSTFFMMRTRCSSSKVRKKW